MQINLNIVGDTPAEIQAALRGLTAAWASAVDITPYKHPAENPSPVPPAPVRAEPIEPTDIAPPAATRKRAKKGEPAPDVTDITPQGELEPTPLEVAIAAVAATPPQPKVEDVRDAIRDLMKATDENTVWKMLSELGPNVKSASTAIDAGKGHELILKAKKIVADKAVAS